jgi:hypothetical protein
MPNLRVNTIKSQDGTKGPTFDGDLEFFGESHIVLPKGTTAERPTGVSAGSLRFNTDTKLVEQYNGVEWVTLNSQFVNDYLDPPVKDGLILNLDAGNPLSYPGFGTIWTDLSGNENSGTLENGVKYNSSNFGSLVFDGVDDSVNITTLDLRQNFTYECWVLHNVVSGFSFLGQGPTTLREGLHIWFRDGSNLRFGMFTNDTDALSLTTSTGVWYQYCFTYNHSTFVKQIYRNGVQLTGTPQETQTSYLGTGTVRIGATYGSGGAYANGRFSSARIYNRVLTAAEVQQNFNEQRKRFNI